jgi:hypothetical protein
VVRYPGIFAKAAEEFGKDFSLTAAETRPSPLSGTRKIMEVVFAFTNRNTDFTEKFFVRVDVTEGWPFLVTKLSPYYDRCGHGSRRVDYEYASIYNRGLAIQEWKYD